MSSTTTRRVAPAVAAAAVAAAITVAVAAHEPGHHASQIEPARSASHAPTYLGRRDFQAGTGGRYEFTATTSGGRVMVGQ